MAVQFAVNLFLTFAVYGSVIQAVLCRSKKGDDLAVAGFLVMFSHQ